MKKAVLVDIIIYFFILLFLYTGIAKITEIHLVKEQLLSAPLLGSPWLANSITWALPIGEILLAVALFIPRFQLKSLYITFALMTLFTIYVIVILFMDSHLACSCGGIIEELSPKQHVLFNAACVILSVVAIAIQRKQQRSVQFRWVTGTSVVVLFAIVGWTLFTAFSVPPTIKTGMEGRLLPSFELLLPDSVTRLNTADIAAGKSFIVIGFAPWCIHCQAETRDIVKNMAKLKDTRIYYVTGEDFRDMRTFYKYFKLSQYSNITMGRDLKGVFMPYFKAKGIPFIAVFDPKKRLKVVFNGEADVSKLATLTAED